MTMGVDLRSPRGGPLHYQGRVDALVVDAYDAYWIIDHRVVVGSGRTWNQLLLDEQGIAACWAWEIFYYGMKIAGTIYNELRLDAPETTAGEAAMDAAAPSPPSRQEADRPAYDVTGRRRRYMEAARIPCGVRGGLRQRGFPAHPHQSDPGRAGGLRAPDRRRGARDDLAGPHRLSQPECGELRSLRLPGALHRPQYRHRRARDPETNFRDRGPEEIVEGRLGGVTWSMNRGARPPKFGS